MIDGTLTSELAIKKVYKTQKRIISYLVNGEKLKEKMEKYLNLSLKQNIYTPPKADDVYKDTITIRENINTLSLNQ